jgi:hypothetical protein
MVNPVWLDLILGVYDATFPRVGFGFSVHAIVKVESMHAVLCVPSALLLFFMLEEPSDMLQIIVLVVAGQNPSYKRPHLDQLKIVKRLVTRLADPNRTVYSPVNHLVVFSIIS